MKLIVINIIYFKYHIYDGEWFYNTERLDSDSGYIL